jgi:uncharacterized protein (TIGR02466 family)
MILNNIFPTVIGMQSLERDFTQDELSFFEKSKLDCTTNHGNKSSKDNYILNNPEMASLKEFVLLNLKNYFNSIYKPFDGVEVVLTQSWLNYTEPGEFHHRHRHVNSFLSGVLYINADKENDKIFFFKKDLEQIKIPATEWNINNSESWFFNVGSKDVAIFPSNLEHMVEKTSGEKTRISLAFNSFLKGNIGSNSGLSELII